MSGLSSKLNAVADYRQPAHSHDTYMLMMPRHGLMHFTDEDSGWSTTLLERQFLLVPPERDHSTASLSTEQSHLVVYVDADYMNHALRELAVDADRFLHKPALGIWASSSTIDHLLLARSHMRQGPVNTGLAQRIAQIDHLLLLECAATALSSPAIQRSTTQKHGAALVRDVQSFLAARLDRALDIETIAETFHISRRHLTRLFADHAGQTVLEFNQGLRMARARQLLEHTGLSVLEIANRVGFQSPSHFAALFRRKHGHAPEEWRRMSTHSMS
jgi:AraC family transcriptional regulator